MPGPPPKPASERRHRGKPRANTAILPAGGRTGPIPKWPLAGRTPAGWADLWRMPQAVMWEQQGTLMVVARYAVLRNLVQNPESLDDVNAAAWSELRQLEDRLGLSPMALLRLQWEIEGTTVREDDDPETEGTGSRVDEVRARLKVVP